MVAGAGSCCGGFGERATWADGGFSQKYNHAFDLRIAPSFGGHVSTNTERFFRIDRENVKRLPAATQKALRWPDRKRVNAVVAANHVAVLADDFALSILQRKRNSALRDKGLDNCT